MQMGDINWWVISPFMVRRENKEWGKGREEQGADKETAVQKDDHQDSEVFWEARKVMRSEGPGRTTTSDAAERSRRLRRRLECWLWWHGGHLLVIL